jgi:hypothetical protein
MPGSRHLVQYRPWYQFAVLGGRWRFKLGSEMVAGLLHGVASGRALSGVVPYFLADAIGKEWDHPVIARCRVQVLARSRISRVMCRIPRGL